MLERCEVIETQHALDRRGYRCLQETCLYCSDCGSAAVRTERNDDEAGLAKNSKQRYTIVRLPCFVQFRSDNQCRLAGFLF